MNSFATVQYRDNSCVGLIDEDFGDYYYSLIPKSKNANKQKYPPHITIVRNFEEVDLSHRYLDGEKFDFNYSPRINFDGKYFFLDCWSQTVDKIRLYCKIERYRLGNSHHITIGNVK